jgi:hypothetical protein
MYVKDVSMTTALSANFVKASNSRTKPILLTVFHLAANGTNTCVLVGRGQFT